MQPLDQTKSPAVTVSWKRNLLIVTAFFVLVIIIFKTVRSGSSPSSLVLSHFPLRAKIGTNETRTYQINLSADEYMRLQFECDETDAKITGYSPEGIKIFAFQSRRKARIPLSIIGSSEGAYRLEVQAFGAASISQLLIELEEKRPKTTNDELRLSAEKAGNQAAWLCESDRSEDLRQTIEYFQAAQSHWQLLNESRNVALCLRQLGKTYLRSGQLNESIQSLKLAFEESQKISDEIVRADIENDLGWALVEKGATPTAISHISHALQSSGARNYEPGQAQALFTFGYIAERGGRAKEALSYYDQAMEFWRRLKDQKGQAATYLHLGYINVALGERQSAVNRYNQALDLWRLAKDVRGETETLAALGHLASMIGEKQVAKNWYEQAQERLQHFSDRKLEAGVMNGLGFLYDELGEKPKALEYRRNALALFKELELPFGKATIQMQVGRLFQQLGNLQQAMENYQEALVDFRALQNPQREGHVLRDIGSVYEALGQPQMAQKHYQQSLQLSNQMEDKRGKANALLSLGRIYQKSGKPQLALQHYDQALQLNRYVNDLFGETQTLYLLAQLALAKRNLTLAHEQIESAARIVEKLRAQMINQELRTSYYASVNQILSLHIVVLMQRHLSNSHENFAAQALAISERARARSLLDLLNESQHDIKQGGDPKLLELERSLGQRLNSKADLKLQLTGKKGKEEELTAITKEVDDLSFQLSDVRSKIRETSPRYAALTQPQPLKADEIQQLLDDETVLLEYALGDERSYVWAVTRNSIEAYTLPNRATIESLVREVYQLMTTSPQQEGETAGQWHQRVTQADQHYWPRAANLSQMVLGPMAEKLGNKRLLIVGDGALQLLPFAALPKPVAGSRWLVVGEKTNPPPATNHQPLIVRHEITYLPSASSLQMLRQDRAKPEPPSSWLARWTHSIQSWLGQAPPPASLHSVAVLADPVFGKEDKRMRGKESKAAPSTQPQMRDADLSDKNVFLPRLIATREEAEAIQKAAGANAFLLKQGFEVNRTLLESDALNRYGVIHFATHGFWDSVNPELSGIFLSRFDRQGNPLDGTLRLSDIYNLKLPKELVVLSACETAVGKDIRGEGLIALTRGFMYAGAARVMASLWKVEDNATAEMMKVFYQHLLQDKISPAAALRQAQIAMWQKEPTQTPYNWAAFVLQGEYR